MVGNVEVDFILSCCTCSPVDLWTAIHHLQRDPLNTLHLPDIGEFFS